ncbi:hypothetical protein [Polyangium sp. 6x1]|uniref:hypothetical protein n=1 Tax=Polyangium sp. 6x1 TaxID=3042689 RepID=UPI002482B962|nr:hypothetical protein [Polyangium sp. 6x1]MDI1444224.1 hypothetical protein [Polyangium sp. 6x1]
MLIIAGLSGTDPRTVEKCLSGNPVRGVLARERIETALRTWDAMVAAYELARREAAA